MIGSRVRQPFPIERFEITLGDRLNQRVRLAVVGDDNRLVPSLSAREILGELIPDLCHRGEPHLVPPLLARSIARISDTGKPRPAPQRVDGRGVVRDSRGAPSWKALHPEGPAPLPHIRRKPSVVSQDDEPLEARPPGLSPGSGQVKRQSGTAINTRGCVRWRPSRVLTRNSCNTRIVLCGS